MAGITEGIVTRELLVRELGVVELVSKDRDGIGIGARGGTFNIQRQTGSKELVRSHLPRKF